jgi:hypothetical protein
VKGFAMPKNTELHEKVDLHAFNVNQLINRRLKKVIQYFIPKMVRGLFGITVIAAALNVNLGGGGAMGVLIRLSHKPKKTLARQKV